ncbi:MAG: hypothetical protein HMLIMOIP_001843 [Candidatus Nitrosomirales archaeon]|jgi:hypothetical protein
MATIDPSSLIIMIIMLIIVWIVVSVPVYFSAKIVTNGRARFTQAMGATALGPIVYAIVLFATIFVLGALVGDFATLPAVLLAILAWLGVYRSIFDTTWLKALGIALLAIVVFIVASFLIGLAAVAFIPDLPTSPLPTPIPSPFQNV